MRRLTNFIALPLFLLAVCSGGTESQLPEIIYTCINPAGKVRIVDGPDECRPNETLLSWNQVGPRGDTGEQGPQGEPGADGATGPAGPPGADGADGATGPAGPPGADGADGAAGPAGPPGADGADGATGPAGPSGADGAVGPAGPAGADGADGATGPAGPPGEDGADGAEGPAGPPGADGAPGPTGPSGPPGESAAGFNSAVRAYASNHWFNMGGVKKIPFSLESYDLGDEWDTSTSRFTANESGLYSVSVMGHWRAAGGAILYPTKNGSTDTLPAPGQEILSGIGYAFTVWTGNGEWHSVGFTMDIQLEAGEFIEIYTRLFGSNGNVNGRSLAIHRVQ